MTSKKQWIDRAIEGIEIYSVSGLSKEQKNGIAIQFAVLMDQIDILKEENERMKDGIRKLPFTLRTMMSAKKGEAHRIAIELCNKITSSL